MVTVLAALAALTTTVAAALATAAALAAGARVRRRRTTRRAEAPAQRGGGARARNAALGQAQVRDSELRGRQLRMPLGRARDTGCGRRRACTAER